MIDYELFSKLYNEAKQYNSLEWFVSERGWQEWMNLFDVDMIAKMLEIIYEYSRCTIKDIRNNLNISRASFSRKYGIPLRTIEDWDSERSKIPKYTAELIKYTLFVKEMMPDEEDSTE
nr:MAG TPA: putative transcriptional regulator [Caudoviricetes sp.]